MDPVVIHKVSDSREVFGVVVDSRDSQYSVKPFQELHRLFRNSPWASEIENKFYMQFTPTGVYSFLCIDEQGHTFAKNIPMWPFLQESWADCIEHLVSVKSIRPDWFCESAPNYLIMALISIPIPFSCQTLSSEIPEYLSEFGFPWENLIQVRRYSQRLYTSFLEDL